MLRNSASAHPDLPPQHHRGSPYHIPDEEDHGYHQSPRQQHERSTSSSSTIATPPHRENAFNAPRPSLLPYQEYHSGFTDDDLASSSPLSPSYSHRRQTSFSNLLPLALRNRTPSPTRKTSVLAGGGEMPFTGDGRSRPGTAASESSSPRGLAGWLSGTTTAAAGNLSSRMDSRTTPDVTPTRLRKNTTTTTTLDSPNIETTPSAASRFMSALSTRLTATSQPQPPPPPHPSLDSDPLYNLDIESALFPSPLSSDRDAFSPAAFKNLHLNAAGWLSRFQAAYRSLALAAKEAEAARGAERDELEEAATRAAHLKMQLEGMARRAAEQEEAMRLLVEELVAERRGREEERVLRQRAAAAQALGVNGQQQEEEEGEEWREREGKRKSGGSGESWGETDEESESVDESVFSRSRSPTTTTGTVDGGSVVDVPVGVLKSGTGTVRAQAQRGSTQMSTFQKIFKNIAGDVDEVSGCRNCRGKDASVAWDTVSLLRDENRHLKQRVGQLEVAVEGALDMVNGLGL